VRRAQSGEHRAFNLLLDKYRHRLMKLSMRYTRNRADAEDAVQETFLRVYKGLKYFRGEAEFSSWLHRIAINSAKNVLSFRSRYASVMAPELASGNEIREAGLVHWDTPEGLVLTEEIGRAVNATIKALCEEQRTAILLREIEGLSYAEIASSMSCPVGTVRSRVFRAREVIDEQLRPVFDGSLGRARPKRSAPTWSSRARTTTPARDLMSH